ncbi:class A beta-lactamase [Arenimonas composti]|uniref:Beta-lactamase n=1 Tax=Arenimonas composti TR7-09 = DSM 18010 TaxID=1121013 RepID=A0A091BCP3_9GAMM|nr:class A beta-lactamase [Arenimonas composti]KFN49486.1 hypothetical protein P873_10965 [Arenimonas composti TR7-09 = DSM 18010]
MILSRRRLLVSSLAAMPALAFARERLPWGDDPANRIADLEERHGGRLGVAVLDTATGEGFAWRAYERFPMCSTFKWLLAAQVLAAVDAGEASLDRRLHWRREDLISGSPVVGKADPAAGLTVGELCAAAITTSDNTAANRLLAEFGGPSGLTAWLRATGDESTRLDRNEPTLNLWRPGELRDTTTPMAMADSLRRILTGDVLSAASRAQLIGWLLANTTGDSRLRAGLSGWRVGDKTGTGNDGTSNDVAIAWPPRSPDAAPILIAAYYCEGGDDAAKRDAVLAEVGAIAGAWAKSA